MSRKRNTVTDGAKENEPVAPEQDPMPTEDDQHAIGPTESTRKGVWDAMRHSIMERAKKLESENAEPPEPTPDESLAQAEELAKSLGFPDNPTFGIFLAGTMTTTDRIFAALLEYVNRAVRNPVAGSPDSYRKIHAINSLLIARTALKELS